MHFVVHIKKNTLQSEHFMFFVNLSEIRCILEYLILA